MRNDLRKIDIATLASDTDKIKHLIRYGSFAPSTHNTQPWLVTISGATVQIRADFNKVIPEADPEKRDMFLSIGALIKNIELAAEAYQIQTATDISAQIDQQLVATITFANLMSALEPSDRSTLDAILDRQNFRGFFDKTIDESVIYDLVHEAESDSVKPLVIFDPQTKLQIAELTVQGLKMGYANPAFRQEISQYINHNASMKRTGLHGYSLRLNLPLSYAIPKVMKRKDIGAKLAKLNHKSFITAPAVVVINAPDTPTDWVRSGQALEYLMVHLTQKGIRSSIYAASVEMGELRKQLEDVVRSPDGTSPQLLFCIGKSSQDLPYSLRQEINDILSV